MKFSTIQAKAKNPVTQKDFMFSLLFAAIDLDYLKSKTEKEAFLKLGSLINNTHSYIKNEQERFQHHLQGLGEGLNLPFCNYDILEWAKKCGVFKVATEKQEDRFLENYWPSCAFALLQICKAAIDS